MPEPQNGPLLDSEQALQAAPSLCGKQRNVPAATLKSQVASPRQPTLVIGLQSTRGGPPLPTQMPPDTTGDEGGVHTMAASSGCGYV